MVKDAIEQALAFGKGMLGVYSQKADVSTCSTAIDGAGGQVAVSRFTFIMQTRRKRCAIFITSPVRHHNRHR